MGKVKTPSAIEGKTVSRSIYFPANTYADMKDENNLESRAGSTNNTEDTIVGLVADGVKYRKLVRAGKIKE